jgi:hypothetical protein
MSTSEMLDHAIPHRGRQVTLDQESQHSISQNALQHSTKFGRVLENCDL